MREPFFCKCKYCGQVFKRKRTSRPERGETNEYCSRACGYKGRGLKTQAKIKEKKEQSKYKYGFALCDECGELFLKHRPETKYCSKECQYKSKLVKDKTEQLVCIECSTIYTSFKNKSHPYGNTCPKCVNRISSKSNKAKRRDAYQEHVYFKWIYQRDNGTCQICGKKAPLKYKQYKSGINYHPLAPTLDHIIPISKGGKHCHSNVQIAHYYCNSIKSNTDTLDQLRLC